MLDEIDNVHDVLNIGLMSLNGLLLYVLIPGKPEKPGHGVWQQSLWLHQPHSKGRSLPQLWDQRGQSDSVN